PELIRDEFGVLMGLVPGGGFEMGGADGEADAEPVHDVVLETFYIDPHEVTNASYAECVFAGICDTPAEHSSQTRKNYYGDTRYGDYPVLNINWMQANRYCEWRGARLPTEAEWEIAARGGLIGENYPWGDDEPICQAGMENGAKFDDGNGCSGTDTEAVGSFAPNGYGLYDMAGNLGEWTADWYAVDYYAGSPVENPTGPPAGEHKVIRGGSWDDDDTNFLKVFYRGHEDPQAGSPVIGFRCVRTAADSLDPIGTAQAAPIETEAPVISPTPSSSATSTSTSTATLKPTNTYQPPPPTATPKPTKKPTKPPEPPTATPAP
ncbi:MAG: SUMF1/EgtB/PvdO family nonheme iron enzyme, partial [Chloroflexota bacterium]|nr:SUMF1/EgtB/PvdO family nonheme iron enzyme [Chloroflexota bacterium]